MKALIAVALALIPTAIWWAIITFIAFAITKSGGTGEWVNEYKPYVLVIVFLISFLSIWLNIKSGTQTRLRRRGRRI